MRIQLPPTRYRVIRYACAGYEAQFRPWWSLIWMECSSSSGRGGINSSSTIEEALQLCAKHCALRTALNQPRVGQVVAEISACELQAQEVRRG